MSTHAHSQPPRRRPLGQRIIRRTVFTLGGLFAAFIVLGIIGSIIGPPPAQPASVTSTPAADAQPAPLPAPSPVVAAPAPAPATAAVPVVAPVPTVESGTVAGVIDGDTFELSSGDLVRVLGIDSCEMSTDAGPRAKAAAESLLSNPQVTLEREPGVDRDRYGRLLRYVSTAYGADMGETMVTGPHTGVYTGENDAAPQRLQALQALDHGRECSDPDVPPVYSSSDDDHGGHVDSNDNSRRSHPSSGGGRVGRDGDGDGWCNESTVPVPC